jgi:hypothetical protein
MAFLTNLLTNLKRIVESVKKCFPQKKRRRLTSEKSNGGVLNF